MKPRLLLCLGVFFLVSAAGVQLGAQATKMPGTPPAPAASPRIWRSETTGNEYRVWLGKGRLTAEWINVPPALAKDGASIRSEFRRVGAKLIGTTRSFLPCDTTEAGKRVVNRCQLETKIEIHSIQTNRITGRGEGLKRFDCSRCQILETVWRDFTWVPKEQSAGGGKK